MITTLLYLTGLILYGYLGIKCLIANAKNQLNKLYFIICLTLMSWIALSILINISPDAMHATIFRLLTTFSWGSVFAIVLHYILIMTNHSRFFRNPLSYVLLYAPAAFSIWLYYVYQPVVEQELMHSSLGWIFIDLPTRSLLWRHYQTVYYLVYMIIGICLVIIWGRKTPYKREKKQANLIVGSMIAVLVLGCVFEVLLPKTGFVRLPSFAALIFFIPMVTIWQSIRKYRLMNLNPQSIALEIHKLMDEGLIITDADQKIIEINQGALKLLGYEKLDLDKKTLNILFDDAAPIDQLNQVDNQELLLLHKSNETIPALVSKAVMTDAFGDRIGSVTIFRDISELKRVQLQLQQAYDEMEQRVQERTKELIQSNAKLAQEVESRIEIEKNITKMAYYDQITDLPNRRRFYEELTQTILTTKDGNTIAILFLDLDSFKMVNDTMGHQYGDELLKEVAHRLSDAVRPTDLIARVGGDEFLILLKDLESMDDIIVRTSVILASFKEPFKLNHKECYMTTSIGIACFPIDGTTADELIKNADIAMYNAKDKGKNRFEFCNNLLKTQADSDMLLTNALYHAIEQKEFELYYQPQVDTVGRCIVGFEALIRWHHPMRGLIRPGDFIPIAEKSGLIVALGNWALIEACRQNKEWQDAGLLQLPVAVNLSAKQFRDGRIIEQVEGALNSSGLDARYLELEITESLVMQDIPMVVNYLHQLKNLGVSLSIDDFGTEYASLNYLKLLPVNKIKIAMSFIHGISINQEDEAITKAIIQLSKDLNMSVIAEGVENKLQLDFLSACMCTLVQGYYFYHPMTAKEIEALICRT